MEDVLDVSHNSTVILMEFLRVLKFELLNQGQDQEMISDLTSLDIFLGLHLIEKLGE